VREETETDIQRRKRCKGLCHLLGVAEAEAGDTSITGRLSIITKLKAAKRAEIERGKAGSWLYDVNRHLSLCGALRREYEALEEFLAAGDAALKRRRRGRGFHESHRPAP
jgi:hypothetical protein